MADHGIGSCDHVYFYEKAHQATLSYRLEEGLLVLLLAMDTPKNKIKETQESQRLFTGFFH